MLTGRDKLNAETCLKKFKAMLDNPGPRSLGMQGLADLNYKEDIKANIIALENIIYSPSTQLNDNILRKLCPSISNPERLEANYKETMRKIDVLNKKTPFPTIYGSSIMNKDAQKASANRLSQPRKKGGRKRRSIKKRSSKKRRSSRKKSRSRRSCRSRH